MTAYPARPPLTEAEHAEIERVIQPYADRLSGRAPPHPKRLNPQLAALEAEAIHIIREVAAEFANPVMLYSIGKDSGVLLHLAAKAFFPAPPPFPFLHVDTTFKFRQMIAFRDRLMETLGYELRVAINWDGVAKGISPMASGSSYHTTVMKTEALRSALTAGGYDAAFGGARRDEEKSRAKERVFSFRDSNHGWDPKNQRPELWNIYNTRHRPGESIRVFPISNWTERDIWEYIAAEDIPLVPLYLAQPRPTVVRDGQIFMVDDDRILMGGSRDEIVTRSVRFRTLGCYPLTAAVESEADTLDEVLRETLASRTSERAGRLIDYDEAASMEKKKREGYF